MLFGKINLSWIKGVLVLAAGVLLAGCVSQTFAVGQQQVKATQAEELRKQQSESAQRIASQPTATTAPTAAVVDAGQPTITFTLKTGFVDG